MALTAFSYNYFFMKVMFYVLNSVSWMSKVNAEYLNNELNCINIVNNDGFR